MNSFKERLIMSQQKKSSFNAAAAQQKIWELESQLQREKDKASELKIDKSEKFDEERVKLKKFLAQLDIYIDSQKNKIRYEKNKMLLAVSFLKEKIFDWFESYVRAQFHETDQNRNQDVNDVMTDYSEFIKRLWMIFKEVNKWNEAERWISKL